MVFRLSLGLLAGALGATCVVSQQLPDMLIGDADHEYLGVIRLMDRDGDGLYDSDPATTDEAMDYFRYGPFFTDSDFHQILRADGIPGGFYALDWSPNSPEASMRIALFRDLNLDGWIGQTEVTPALTTQWWGYVDPETYGMAFNGNGYAWTTNAGAAEGIFYSRDLNGDGDFMDTVVGVDETICLIAELTNRTVRTTNHPAGGEIGSDSWRVYRNVNVPNAQSVFVPYEIDEVFWDPSTSPGSLADTGPLPGKFLFEDEEEEVILALEDLNGDGDYIDTSDPNPANWDTDFGELYLWCVLYNGPGTRTWNADANPDVGGGLLPSSIEIRHISMDTSGSQPVYYLSNGETGSSPAANRLFRAVDVNLDGDINDAGEVTPFFQATAADPVLPMRHIFTTAVWNGDVLLVADRIIAGGEIDVIVRLSDANGDNTIDNATEVTEVFSTPRDVQLRYANIFQPFTTGVVPPGLPAMLDYRNTPTCFPVANMGVTPNTLTVGGALLGDDVPLLGRTIRINNRDATPNASSALWIGFEASQSFPLSSIGLGPCSIASAPTQTVGMTTAADGSWTFQFAVPNHPSFIGVEQAFEAVTLDIPNSRVDVSNMAVLRYGRWAYRPPLPAP